MKKRLIIKLFSLILLVGCSFQPIYSTKKVNFAIIDLKTLGSEKINFKLKQNLKNYENKKNKEKFYKVKINTEKTKSILSKDSKGNPKNLNIEIQINLKVYEKDILKFEKNFLEDFNYNNDNKKFALKKYEESIEDNLVDKILEKIILYFYTM